MHAAAKANQAEIVKLLVEAGFDIDARGGYDEATALHMATWDDRGPMVKTLISRRAGVNVRSGKIHNNGPAGWAIVAGSAGAFELLMDNGADVLDWFERDAQKAVDGDILQINTCHRKTIGSFNSVCAESWEVKSAGRGRNWLRIPALPLRLSCDFLFGQWLRALSFN